METALKEILLPGLREVGFKGTLPHLRRILRDRVDYLTVQFYSAGGSFVIVLASAGPDGKPHGLGSDLPIEKLHANYFNNRFRLGSNPSLPIDDHWFKFGSRSYESPSTSGQEHYQRIAQEVHRLFKEDGEKWLFDHAGAA